MEQSVAQFIVGAIVLLLSTQYFIKFAERISLSLKLSPLIIGLTIVSIGTSLPELTISTIAAMQGDMGLALGNLIGSNIVNVFLVLGIGILTGTLRIGTTKTQRNIYIMTGVTALFLCMYIMGVASAPAGILLILLALLISYGEYVWGVSGRSHEDAVFFKRKKKGSVTGKDIFLLAGILCGVVLGGILTVSAVERLSMELGLSTTILGLSITAIVTSLPELLTTLLSQRDHEEKLTIGNLIGSNIYNLALIGGIVLLFSSWKYITRYEIVMLLSATAAFTGVVVLYKGKIIPKYIGYFLIVLFCLYIYFLR